MNSLDKKASVLNSISNAIRTLALVREKGLEPSRLRWDTGTSSLPVYLFQHSRAAMVIIAPRSANVNP